MKEQILFNPDNSGADICRTIKHSYNGCRANLIRTSTFGQTGVLEIETMQELINADSNGNAKAIRDCYGQCGFDSVLRGGGQCITGVMEEIQPKIVGYTRDKKGVVVKRSLRDTSNTVTTFTGSGHNTDMYVAEPKIAASRGRGKGWQQQLEINDSGTSNTITTSLKDNLLLEPRKEGIKIGERYGRLTVLEKTSKRQGTNYLYKCQCDCGNIKLVPSDKLGISTFSCGCYKVECHRTHNESKTRLYNIWIGMKSRCCNPNNPSYPNYGGRGIGICDEWRNSFEKFRDWAYLNGYSEHYTIDRINNNGNYEPQNCRWTTETTQVRNRNPYGEIPYDGIVKDATGYRAQITINGKKIYIAHSVDDIEYLVNKRNEYIIEHNLDFKIQKYIKENPMKDEKSNTTDSSKSFSSNTDLRMEGGCLVDKDGKRYRIRKLTPTECFRLQDVSDEDIEKIRSYRDDETKIIRDVTGEPIINMEFVKPSRNERKITVEVNGEQREYYGSQLIWKKKGKEISKTAQYKLAGNSICVAPMYHIFRKLFIEKGNENQQLELF